VTWLRHRTALALLCCLGAWLAWLGWLQASAPGRLSPSLRSALAAGRSVGLVAVDLGFKPTGFQLDVLQRFGTVSGVRGKEVMLADVGPAEMWGLAHIFWIQRIRRG
jgi:hypothetical protein